MTAGSTARLVAGRAVVVLLAAAAGLLAQTLRLPGAWVLGPMLVGIGVGIRGSSGRLFPRWLVLGAQGIVGTLVAGAFDPATVPKIVANWLGVLIGVGGTLAASVLVGIVLARMSSMHRATTTLGTLPGGANATIALSVALGADTRSIALMQYMRIVLTVLSASLVARLTLAFSGASTPTSLAAISPASQGPTTYLATAAVAATGLALGVGLRLPGGVVLGPLVAGVAAAGFGLVRPGWPPGVPEAAYVVIGLYVGTMFDRVAIRSIRGQLPAMLASIVGLLTLCAGVGAVLALLTGTDFLTGYLATTPGGLDSLPAIALTSGADVSLMLSVQMVRVIAVVLVGSPLARWLLADVPMPTAAGNGSR